MRNPIKSIFISICLAMTLQACSSPPLQSSRLNAAEDNIVEAEHALKSSQIVAAESYLGTATAYLATVGDFKKFLSSNELSRYQALKQRETRLSKMVKSRKR